jgi:mxaA protein
MKLINTISLLLSLFLLSAACYAEPVLPAQLIKMDQGRNYGLMVGDIIEHHYLIAVDEGYSLSPSSLPVEGELTYWLDLNSVSMTSEQQGKKTIYNLILRYQTFYAPLDVRTLLIPEQQLVFTDSANQRVEITLTDWHFIMSPIKEITASGVGNNDGSDGFMKADIAPRTHSLSRYQSPIIIYASLSIVCLLIWAALAGLLPKFDTSPFHTARRQIKRINRHKNITVDQIQQGLQAMHDAFNSRASYTVFASQIDDFIQQHPQFNESRTQIEDFFQQSRCVFFFDEDPKPNLLNDCIRLCDRLAAADKVVSNKS